MRKISCIVAALLLCATMAFAAEQTVMQYVVNINTKKFHKTTCLSVGEIYHHNRRDYTGTREALIEQGFVPCKRCKP